MSDAYVPPEPEGLDQIRKRRNQEKLAAIRAKLKPCADCGRSAGHEWGCHGTNNAYDVLVELDAEERAQAVAEPLKETKNGNEI